MKNHSNLTLRPYRHYIWSVSHLVIFEVATAIISFMIIVTSGLVISLICGKAAKKSRVDLVFVVLSISDIGVGLFSQTSLGIIPLCSNSYINCGYSNVFSFLRDFFLLFPATFSHVVTAIIAADRLLVLTKQHNYENCFTKRILKCILAFSFILSIGFCCWFIRNWHHYTETYILSYIINLAVNIVLPVVTILAYVYILRFAHRSSKSMSHCMSSGNKIFKRLTKIILFILISQTACFLPYQFMLIVVYIRTTFPIPLVYWFVMLRNTSSFINGTILLLSERRKTKRKRNTETKMTWLKKLQKS